MTKKLLLSASLLFSVLIFAQDKKTETTKESSPSRIKVYTPSSSVSKSSSSNNSYRWIIKTDMFGLASGEFPIIGEYRIATKLSIEASAGFTYAYLPNDFLTSSMVDGNSGDTKAAMGSSFRGAIKYYPSSDYDAIEGWNFGLQVFSKTTNRDYTDSSNYDGVLSGQKDTKTKTGISLIIGKQIFQDSNVAFESYVGIGIANVKRTYASAVYNSSTSNYELSNITTNEMKPNFQLGFRIGFGN
jgi:hypothetical protein